MARIVREIMNPELFSLRPSDAAEDALGYILALGVTGAPVVDTSGKPVGVASFRDLVARRAPASVEERMTRPALVIDEHATIEDAARMLSDSGVHRLVAVDDGGRAVGIVSALDVIRGLMGLPASHPATFPHYDQASGVSWTDDTELDLDHVGIAPDGPGVLVLVRGGREISEAVVWAEAAFNVRTRLYDILSLPQDAPLLARMLRDDHHLRFRAASIQDPSVRMKVLERLLGAAHKKLEAASA